MGRKVYNRPPKKGEHHSFSIGAMDAGLSDEVISGLKLDAALKRFGKELIKKYEGRKLRDSGQVVVGVNLQSIGFNLIFGDKP